MSKQIELIADLLNVCFLDLSKGSDTPVVTPIVNKFKNHKDVDKLKKDVTELLRRSKVTEQNQHLFDAITSAFERMDWVQEVS